MTQSEIFEMLKGTGMPVSFNDFPDEQDPVPPYIVYTLNESRNKSADGIPYVKISRLAITLYAIDDIDADKSSAKVDSVLEEQGFFYTKTAGKDDDEKMIITSYEMEVMIHAER